MNGHIQLIQKFNTEPLYSLLLHRKVISFNSNWLVIWPPFLIVSIIEQKKAAKLPAN